MRNTLYILGNGFDIDLGFDTTYSGFIRSVHFNGDSFNKDIKGLKHSDLPREIIKIANFIEKQSSINLWFDLEMGITEYYDNLNLEQEYGSHNTNISIDKVLEKHKSEIIPLLRKAISNYIRSNVIYTYNNLRLKDNSRAYKLLMDMFVKIFDGSDSKIITFNYTGTAILKKELKAFCQNSMYTISDENLKKIDESIISIHGDYEDQNRDGEIVLGNSERYIKNNTTKRLLNKTRQESIINGIRDETYFSRFDNFIIFGHSLGESDSYFFKNLIDYFMNSLDKKLYIFTTLNGRESIIDNIEKNDIKYDSFTSRIHPFINEINYLNEIESSFAKVRESIRKIE